MFRALVAGVDFRGDTLLAVLMRGDGRSEVAMVPLLRSMDWRQERMRSEEG